MITHMTVWVAAVRTPASNKTADQATGPDSAAAYNARAIVLPAPAGPVTTVSGHRRVPSAISAVIRGRGTTQSGTPGAVIFAARIGSAADIADRLVRVAACPAKRVAIGTSGAPNLAITC
jgi:hypothetical protein